MSKCTGTSGLLHTSVGAWDNPVLSDSLCAQPVVLVAFGDTGGNQHRAFIHVFSRSLMGSPWRLAVGVHDGSTVLSIVQYDWFVWKLTRLCWGFYIPLLLVAHREQIQAWVGWPSRIRRRSVAETNVTRQIETYQFITIIYIYIYKPVHNLQLGYIPHVHQDVYIFLDNLIIISFASPFATASVNSWPQAMVVHWGDPLLPGLLLGGLPGAMEGEWVGIRAILERNSQLSYLFNPRKVSAT